MLEKSKFDWLTGHFTKFTNSCTFPIRHPSLPSSRQTFFLQSPPSSECSAALRRMNACPTCSLGRTELRPCKNFCLDVMNSCLDSHIEIQEQWDKFVGGWQRVCSKHTFSQVDPGRTGFDPKNGRKLSARQPAAAALFTHFRGLTLCSHPVYLIINSSFFCLPNLPSVSRASS